MMTLAYYYFVRVREWLWRMSLGWVVRKIEEKAKFMCWCHDMERRQQIRREIMAHDN